MEQLARTLRSLTLEELLEEHLAERMLRPATAQTYRMAVRRWIAETGIDTVEAVTREAVLAWRERILARARPETWNKYRRHLRTLLNRAVRSGLIPDNPFARVAGAPPARRIRKTVPLDDIARAIELLESPDEPLPPGWFWAMVLRAFFYTGVRLRQLVELEWGDVDLERGLWHIRAETSKTRREWLVPLAPPVVDDLVALRHRTASRLGGRPGPRMQVYNVTLFHPRYRGPRTREVQVGGLFQRLSRELGGQITPHRLRHTMATALAPHGDIRTLQALLGHAHIATTMQYVHPDVDGMRRLIEHLPQV